MPKLGAAVAEQDLDQLTNLFGLLADKTRLNILLSLAEGERNVGSLCQELQLPQPTVSHHLGLLRFHNIITNRRRGKHVFYSLNGALTMGNGPILEISLENFSVRLAGKVVTSDC